MLRPRAVAGLVLAGAALTLGGALVFEHGLGYLPCKLCLTERVPYYVVLPLTALALLVPERATRWLLGLAALVLLYGAGLGAYHSGAEWGLWPGPSDCGGGSGTGPGDVGDFLRDLETKQVADCTKPAWRFLGLSLAGWNAVIAAGLAALAGKAALSPQPSAGPDQPGR